MSQQDNAMADILKWVLILGVVAAVVLWVMHALFGGGPDREPDPRQQAAVEQRIAPFGTVQSGEVAQVAAGEGEVRAGADVYAASCAACHTAGVAGAPRTGQAGDWQPRLDERGMDGLLQNAITGIGGMPPRGGAPNVTDEELQAAIEHMLQESGVSP
ncbi:cytochrome c5 family protein [Ectothiorhodospiraceae bacterium 2226]|nr:cytochrome c5 family protein [Ectothiorhodospiraceae bacterium 2226]